MKTETSLKTKTATDANTVLSDGNFTDTHCYIDTTSDTFLCTVKISAGVVKPSKVLVNGNWVGIRKFDKTHPNYSCGGYHRKISFT